MGEFRPPEWAKPVPLGSGQAADAAHFVAAPLLASSCVAMIGVIGTSGKQFRWSGFALLALALAAMALVASVQQGFHARALLYSAGDLEEWWGSRDLVSREDMLRKQQRGHFEQWKRKINRAVTAYNVGVTLLGVGVAVSLAPPVGTHGGDAAWRWIACVAVAMGAFGEFLWTVVEPRWCWGCCHSGSERTRSVPEIWRREPPAAPMPCV